MVGGELGVGESLPLLELVEDPLGMLEGEVVDVEEIATEEEADRLLPEGSRRSLREKVVSLLCFLLISSTTCAINKIIPPSICKFWKLCTFNLVYNISWCICRANKRVH